MTRSPFDTPGPLPPRAYKIIRRTDRDAVTVEGPSGPVLLPPWLADAVEFAKARGWGGLGRKTALVHAATPPTVGGDRASLQDVEAHREYMLRGDDRALARAEPGVEAHLKYMTRGDARGAR